MSVAALVSCEFSAPITRPREDAGAFDSGTPSYDGGATLDAGLAPLEACALLNEARCAALARCGLVPDTVEALGNCERAFEATWCGPTTWPNHVTAGSLRLDSSRALACVGALQVQACTDWPNLPDSCSRFLLPRAALGQPCFDGYDECLEGICRGTACPRTCQPKAVLNEPCTSDLECRTGLFCRTSPLNPGTGQCAMPSAANELCLQDADCNTGLVCSQQLCKPLPSPGQPCLEGRCTDAAYCDWGVNGGTCTLRKDEGATCITGECQSALVCDPYDGRCAPIVSSMHERCTAASKCPAGTVCVGLDASGAGSCLPHAAEGETCLQSDHCQSWLTCTPGDADADAGASCQRKQDAGTSCHSDTQCQASGFCSTDACAELPLPGESCAGTRRCRWGLCRDVAGADGGAVCGAAFSAGTMCRSDAECASGTCRDGLCLARCVP